MQILKTPVIVSLLFLITTFACSNKTTNTMQYKNFTFSPFGENTFVLYDETNEAVIIDPGNFHPNENELLDEFIEEHNLKPVQILATHNHLDHLFGAKYVADKYSIGLACHKDDLFWINEFMNTAKRYGLEEAQNPPQPEKYFQHGDIFKFGNTELEIIHVPGHSQGGVAFYYKPSGLLFCGDILFQGSVGRSDFPGGNHEQLIGGIKEKLLTLPDPTIVFSGHGPSSTIGAEKRNNPFLR